LKKKPEKGKREMQRGREWRALNLGKAKGRCQRKAQRKLVGEEKSLYREKASKELRELR